MSEIAATVVAAPSFVAAVETFTTWTAARTTGDQRRKEIREARTQAGIRAERRMRAVAAESGVDIVAVQAVIMAAARVAADHAEAQQNADIAAEMARLTR